ncbi:MAG TPA: hypothetical protein VFQ24_11325 [Terriglobia bacterium]|nr:hypothetical protein [Terriglobia bacterium]
MLKGEALRTSLAGVDMNTQAIRSAPIAVLQQAALDGVADCVNERNIDPDFRWVYARGSAQIKNSAQHGDFDGIRATFGYFESHDDQLRNRLYCRNGSEVRRLLNSVAQNPLALDFYGQPLEEPSNRGAARGFFGTPIRGAAFWGICGLAIGLLVGLIAVILTKARDARAG